MVNLRQAVTHARRGEWGAAHALAQADDSLLGAWLHGILHLMDGDLENAAYWYTRAGRNFAGRSAPAEELARLEAELMD